MLMRDAVENFDLELYLQKFDAKHVGRGYEEWVLECPQCGKRKLSVRIDRKTWHCWRCEQYRVTPDGQRKAVTGAGGLLDLIQLLERCDRDRARDLVLSQSIFSYRDIGLLPTEEIAREIKTATRQSMEIPPPPGAAPITGILPYMVERHITLEDVARLGLFTCTWGPFANRLVFPVWESGRFVYFQARAMWPLAPGEIKALNPLLTEGAAVSSELLMNLDVARCYPRVAITEGPMDCLRAGPSAVCTFGKKISAAQIGKLLQAGVRAVDLMWDADAWADMLQVAPLLGRLFDTRLVRLHSGDPAEHTREQLDWYRAMAIPAAQASVLAQPVNPVLQHGGVVR